jgi:hypothetical protein
MLTPDEKTLWDALGQPTFSKIASNLEPDLRLLEKSLHREYKQLSTFRAGFTLLILFLFILFLFFVIESIQRRGFKSISIFAIIQILLMSFWGSLFVMIRPSARWKNGIEYLQKVSLIASYSTILPILLFVIEKNNQPFFTSGKTLSLKLYPCLTNALMFAEDWTPTLRERRFLQKIALSKKHYPEELRVAALLTLADQNEALESSFTQKVQALAGDTNQSAVTVAAGELLVRQSKSSGQ